MGDGSRKNIGDLGWNPIIFELNHQMPFRNDRFFFQSWWAVVYSPTQWAYQIWLESVENWKSFPCNFSQRTDGLAGRVGWLPTGNRRLHACPPGLGISYRVPGTFSLLCRSGPNSVNMPIGNMGGCPPISRPIREFWTFRKQGPWDKGLARPCPPGSSLPATHCRAGPRERQSPRNFFMSRPVCTKFVIHDTGVQWLLSSNFEENPTNFRRPIQACLARCYCELSNDRIGSRRGVQCQILSKHAGP